MRIMDVQQFKANQYEKYQERRTSQYLRFLDKNVDFVTYYSINKALSTTELGNFNIDSYIGKDSPVRYNKINNLPVYGIAEIRTPNEYEDELGGFTANHSDELVMLPEIIEPCEGDCFIINIYNENKFFVVTQVTQIVLKSRPHYVLTYEIGMPDYLPQLNRQVTDEFNAIFDNIGTQDKVVISHNEYTLMENYKDIYCQLMNYYIDTYFKRKITMFKIDITIFPTPDILSYVDKFLQKFMEKNRIIVMDELTKGALLLDYNALYDDDDYLEYMKSIYWAIENKNMNNIEKCKYIILDELYSPFSLITGETSKTFYVSQYFSMTPGGDNCVKAIAYDNSEIIERYLEKDASHDTSAKSMVMAIITNYLHSVIIPPGYFESLYNKMTKLEEYMYLPIILFIIREQINGLRRKTNIIYS